MRFGFAGLIMLIVLNSSSRAASEVVDFTGIWQLNIERSDFQGVPPPKTLRYSVVHKEPVLRVTSTMTGPAGEVTMAMEYRTDGQERTNKTPAGDIKTVARWQGSVLTISGQAAAMRQEERWSLSKDSKTLTIKITPENENQLTFVLEKR